MDADAVNSGTKSLLSLARELRDGVVLLFHQEAELAKIEATEKSRELGKAIAILALGGVILVIGSLALVFSVSILVTIALRAAGVSADTSAWLGPGIVGGVIAAVGATLVIRARNKLRMQNLALSETMKSLKDTKEWAQDKLSRRV